MQRSSQQLWYSLVCESPSIILRELHVAPWDCITMREGHIRADDQDISTTTGTQVNRSNSFSTHPHRWLTCHVHDKQNGRLHTRAANKINFSTVTPTTNRQSTKSNRTLELQHSYSHSYYNEQTNCMQSAMELQQNAFSLVLNVASNLQTENTNRS